MGSQVASVDWNVIIPSFFSLIATCVGLYVATKVKATAVSSEEASKTIKKVEHSVNSERDRMMNELRMLGEKILQLTGDKATLVERERHVDAGVRAETSGEVTVIGENVTVEEKEKKKPKADGK